MLQYVAINPVVNIVRVMLLMIFARWGDLTNERESLY
jgi:hypothetical protein